MHWCIEETLALCYVLGNIPLMGMFIRSKYTDLVKHSHDEDCSHEEE